MNFTSDIGDGVNSGNFGLGCGQLGAFHPAEYHANNSVDLLGERILYSNALIIMVHQGMKPCISFAMDRIPMDQLSGFGMLPLLLVRSIADYLIRVLWDWVQSLQFLQFLMASF